MRLATTMTLAGIGVAALGLSVTAAVGGCSSSSTDNGGGGGAGTVWPAKPSAPATTSTEEHNFALHTLFLGDADRSGNLSSSAWKEYGYNIDGKITAKDSTDVCTLATGASKSIQVDGAGGIDNSFGENILPIIITTAGADATKKINDSINTGSFTVMLDVKGFASAPGQTATGLTGNLFGAGNFDQQPNATGSKPSWTPSDNWPISPTFVNGGSIGSPKITFNDAYVVNDTFVNGSPTDVTLSLGIAGVTLSVTVHRSIITFQHSGQKALNGTIAGVINTEELINGLHSVAGSISTSLCQGSAFQNIADQIRQASDILSDGTNSAGKPCDSISIGIGFTGDEIGLPKTIGSASSGVDKCQQTGSDAGAEDSGGGGQDSGGGGSDASHD